MMDQHWLLKKEKQILETGTREAIERSEMDETYPGLVRELFDLKNACSFRREFTD